MWRCSKISFVYEQVNIELVLGENNKTPLISLAFIIFWISGLNPVVVTDS